MRIVVPGGSGVVRGKAIGRFVAVAGGARNFDPGAQRACHQTQAMATATSTTSSQRKPAGRAFREADNRWRDRRGTRPSYADTGSVAEALPQRVWLSSAWAIRCAACSQENESVLITNWYSSESVRSL